MCGPAPQRRVGEPGPRTSSPGADPPCHRLYSTQAPSSPWRVALPKQAALCGAAVRPRPPHHAQSRCSQGPDCAQEEVGRHQGHSCFPPKPVMLAGTAALILQGSFCTPPPSSPAIAPRLVAGWGALWNHRKISPCLALWPPFRNSKQSRNDRMEAPSLPGTPLCPELVLLSLQEEKAGVVGVGMRGRASGPASNYLRKSQDECPRQRLLIGLLAHAPLSFPEPSCVMMSQQGPW